MKYDISVCGLEKEESLKAEQYIKGKDKVLEWGSGGTTLYFPYVVNKTSTSTSIFCYCFEITFDYFYDYEQINWHSNHWHICKKQTENKTKIRRW